MVICTDIITFRVIPPFEYMATSVLLYHRERQTVVVHNQIYYICGCHKRSYDETICINFTILNTETNEITKHDYIITNELKFVNATSEGDYIYILLGPAGVIHYRDPPNHYLLKFDTRIYGNMHIQGNFMYYMEGMTFKKLNMSVRPEQKITEFYNIGADFRRKDSLMINENQLYLVNVRDHNRTVSLFDEDSSQIVSQDQWLPRFMNFNDNFDDKFITNDRMITPRRMEDGSNVVLIDTYNFDEHEWNRQIDDEFDQVIEKWRIVAVSQHMDKLYLFATNRRNEDENVVRVLDLKPTLTDICLNNLVKQIVANPRSAAEVVGHLQLHFKERVKRMVQFQLPYVTF